MYVGIKGKIRFLYEMLLEAKWIYQYSKRYWRVTIYYIALGIISTGMGFAGSIASKYLIDVVTGHDSSNIAFIISVLIAMTLGGILVGAITSRLSTKINLRVHNEIQVDVYSKIIYTEWEALSKYHSGDLLNRINQDVSTVADSVLGWIPSLITRLFQFVGTLVIILYYDSTMAVIALLSAPVTLLMSRLLMSRMRDHNKNIREISSEMIAFNEESLQNIQYIKCFRIENSFIHILRKLQMKYVDMTLEYSKFAILTSSFLSIIGLLVSYTAFGWGIYRLWSGGITYGTMTLFLQLSARLTDGFTALVEMIPSAISATTSAGRIMELLKLPREEEDFIDNETDEDCTNNSPLSIKLSDVNFAYWGREALLEGINLHIKPKEFIAIIGPSGEGKTTLIRLLLGLINPSSGDISIIDDSKEAKYISASTRKYFSYVPQGNTLFSGTIADNLRIIKPNATEEEIYSALRAACAYDFVSKLPGGINFKIGENGGGLSEGQAQRLAIARALLRDAPILLMDEATSALDIETEKSVLRSIMSYGVTHTCILTTHRTSVLALCDRVFQIKGTRLIEKLDYS